MRPESGSTKRFGSRARRRRPRLVNRALVISSPDAPPTLLLGQPVTSADDYVKFADANAAKPGDGGFVMVNRITGDVQLFAIKDGVPALIEGAGQRVAPAGAPSTDAPGTRTVSLDLVAVETELGLPDDPSNVAMSVDRGLGLANGSNISASGVAATVASLEAVGTTPSEGGASSDVVEPVTKSSSDNVPVALDRGGRCAGVDRHRNRGLCASRQAAPSPP